MGMNENNTNKKTGKVQTTIRVTVCETGEVREFFYIDDAREWSESVNQTFGHRMTFKCVEVTEREFVL